MLRTSRLGPVLICASALLLLPGCGKKGAPVKGKVVVPSNLKLEENDTVQVKLVPEDKKAEGYSGNATAKDLSFDLHGSTKQGVVPGKYKVVVKIQPYPGAQTAADRKAAIDSINNAYSEANTKLTYDVTPDSGQNITIDLAQGAVKKE